MVDILLSDPDNFSPEEIAQTEEGQKKLVKAASRVLQAVLMAAADEDKVLHNFFDGVDSSAQETIASYSLKKESPKHYKRVKAGIYRKIVEQARVETLADANQQRFEYMESQMREVKAEVHLKHRVLRKASADAVRAKKRSNLARLEQTYAKEIQQKREEVAAAMPELQEERKAFLEAEYRQKNDSLLEESRQVKAKLASLAQENVAANAQIDHDRNQIRVELLAQQDLKRQYQIDLGSLAFTKQLQDNSWKAAISEQAEAKEALQKSECQYKAAEELKADSERERKRVAEKEAKMEAGLSLREAALGQREKDLGEKEQALKEKEARLCTVQQNTNDLRQKYWDEVEAAISSSKQRDDEMLEKERKAAAIAHNNSVAAAQISKDKELLKKKQLAVEAREKKVSVTETQLAAAQQDLDERERNWIDSSSKWLDELEARHEEKQAALGTDVKETSVSPSQFSSTPRTESSTPSSMPCASSPATSPGTPSTPSLPPPGYQSSSRSRKRKLDDCDTVPSSRRRYNS